MLKNKASTFLFANLFLTRFLSVKLSRLKLNIPNSFLNLIKGPQLSVQNSYVAGLRKKGIFPKFEFRAKLVRNGIALKESIYKH